MNSMNSNLIDEAKKYGVNASQYNLLPPRKRENALRNDIERAKTRAEKKGNANGQNKQT
jgi:hypothetical protein